MSSLEELNLLSQQRANRGWIRASVLGVLMLVSVVVLSLLYQRLQNDYRALIREQRAQAYESCLATRNAFDHANAIWANLADIERTNRFVDQAIRDRRLNAYVAAQVPLPVCFPPR